MPNTTLALITGANKGIGFETAMRLGQQGIHILVGARDTARGEEAVQKLAALDVQATFVELDVTDEMSIARAAQSIAEMFGGLDILINNAGISGGNVNTPSATTLSVMRTVYDINVFGVVAVTKAMLPLLRKSQAGRIVNVSSGLGSITLASDRNDKFFQFNNLPYQSSKAAVNAITVEFAKELAETPIKVNAADPGFTATDFNNHRGYRTVEQAATVIVHLATLGEDGPTGSFQDENGNIPW
jgi:Dehydrogenases with different specificities (related to short-chain alcohol dehydrogenases)